jgi:hypothetical protein
MRCVRRDIDRVARVQHLGSEEVRFAVDSPLEEDGLLGAAPAVSQPRGGPKPNPRSWHHKKVARSIQSNAIVQVLPGLAGDVPSPSLIMRTKSQQNVQANGA